ncbi:STAS domain-containing protein [Vibrio genomosp. F10]|uniref:STAS domain-containing protein n=2 Tax=Vibrio genomosp. F10 TaxID=723171 RepID=A0A1B9QYR4_9VIBR|nr:STAS domain-containing protein [Vibrio genomosp. F10]OCH75917.1 hypothetical protein A6E14_10260 [Vibrio genomosp. F10]OEE36607.1 hypothetical protein A1QO_18620 [Vibrio genomosp. F10 str. ZF-129]OEE95299.1 hypothetical protein A1QM_05150 [Vibrio genomosp. F10 str. 9ZC157]OEF10451.1 hypothetical protein A1QI_01135 [Vibrio genomosp. F10 str. 9ZB36]OEF11192.1 hypothetical protein A1QK_05470 [Vibrio genomosp. F10 str. 9ZD137]
MDIKVYLLPQELTIYEVNEVHQDLLDLIETNELIQLDASQVEELDTAGFQLLIWFSKYSQEVNSIPPLCRSGHVVLEYVRTLNVQNQRLLIGQESVSSAYEY